MQRKIVHGIRDYHLAPPHPTPTPLNYCPILLKFSPKVVIYQTKILIEKFLKDLSFYTPRFPLKITEIEINKQ